MDTRNPGHEDPAWGSSQENAINIDVDVQEPPIKRRRYEHQARRWQGTLNNPTIDDLGDLQRRMEEFIRTGFIKDWCFAIEHDIRRQPEPHTDEMASWTPHYHVYIELPMGKKARFSEFGLTKRIHWEPAKGNVQSNVQYLLKGNDQTEYLPGAVNDTFCASNRLNELANRIRADEDEVLEMLQLITPGHNERTWQEQVMELVWRTHREAMPAEWILIMPAVIDISD